MNVGYIENSAFRYFLSIKRNGRTLVLESAYGATSIALSKSQKLCVCFLERAQDASIVLERFDLFGVRNTVIVVGKPESIPFRNESFDLVCGHRTAVDEVNSKEYEREISRVLSENGECYIGWERADNGRLVREANGKRLITGLIRSGKFTKLAEVHHYPSLDKVNEIRLDEKKRGWLRLHGPRRIMKAIRNQNKGCILRKGSGNGADRVHSCESWIEKLKRSIKDQHSVMISRPNLLRVGSGGSVILDLASIIARIPQTEAGTRRCVNNYISLKRLSKKDIGVDVPKALGVIEVEGQHIFLESKIEGRSLDEKPLSHKGIKTIRDQAVEILCNIERYRIENIDENLFDAVVKKEFDRVARYARLGDKRIIDRAINVLREQFVNKKVPLVINHGDFKESNFITKGAFRQEIVGLIDWDKSRIPGLPLVDLLYFLTSLEDAAGNDFALAMWAKAINCSKDLTVRDYMEKLGIDIALTKSLGLCAVVNWIADFCLSTEARDDWYRTRKMGCWSDSWYKEVISMTLVPACLECIQIKRIKPFEELCNTLIG